MADRDTTDEITMEQSFNFRVEPPKWEIAFQNAKGKKVGTLKFNSHGELDFKGDATRSAEVFFRAVVRANNQTLEDMRELAEMGFVIIDQDFMPNVGQCAGIDFEVLNNFLIRARAEFGNAEET